MASTIDLHIHTTASDGSDSPALLLENLRRSGITIFSVTDHDSMEGALEMEKLVTPEFRFIRGIEFSCESPRGKCHILGYGYDPADTVFLAALQEGKDLRQEKLETRIRYLKEKLGILLTPEESAWLRSLESPGKPHFGRIILDRGMADSLDEAIQQYINPCRIRRDRIEAQRAIDAILHAGGVPVWAHPLGGEGEKRLDPDQFRALLAHLMDQGIQGLECHYSRYSPEDSAFLTEQARIHGLLISGGSDYHGRNKQDLPLGRLSTTGGAVSPDKLTILHQL